jgi:hypothetical protein
MKEKLKSVGITLLIMVVGLAVIHAVAPVSAKSKLGLQ